MFINIERIHKIHRKFLATLEHQDSREYIGSVFLNTVRSFEPYNEYCAKYQEAVDKVAELRKNVDSFDTFLRYCRCRPECHQLELTAFLIKPLQRICKVSIVIFTFLPLFLLFSFCLSCSYLHVLSTHYCYARC
jgi:hypothetical protein